MSKWMLILIAGGGLIFLALTLTFTYEVVLLDYITMLVVVIFGTTLAYMTTVKFHSPMIVSENEKFNPTMFDSRAEVLDDREWGHQLGIVYWSGYNAPKRVFSKRDIETGGKASILITLSPFMIESIGNARFLAIRGFPHESNFWEAKAFLNRPSIKDALSPEFKRAKIHFAIHTKTMHEDEPLSDMSVLGDLAATLQEWRGEIASTADLFSEEFKRRLGAIKQFRESGLSRMVKDKQIRPAQPEEEEQQK